MYDICLQHLLRQEYAYFADNFGGSLVTRANRMAKGFELFTYSVFLEMLGLLTGVLVALGIMVFINPWLGLVVTAIWLAGVVLVVHLALGRMPIRRAAVAKETQQTGELADIVANAVTVKTFAQETAEEARYHRTNEARTRLYMRSWHTANSKRHPCSSPLWRPAAGRVCWRYLEHHARPAVYCDLLALPGLHFAHYR
jgi:ABC-type multidrug transport system fused ATPase/permease subunit